MDAMQNMFLRWCTKTTLSTNGLVSVKRPEINRSSPCKVNGFRCDEATCDSVEDNFSWP
jgi:hypothetical protein